VAAASVATLPSSSQAWDCWLSIAGGKAPPKASLRSRQGDARKRRSGSRRRRLTLARKAVRLWGSR